MIRVNLPENLGDADKLAGPLGSSLEVRARTDPERQMLSELDAAAEMVWTKQPKAVAETARGNNLFQRELGTQEEGHLLSTSLRELLILNGLCGLLPVGWRAGLCSIQGRNPALGLQEVK